MKLLQISLSLALGSFIISAHADNLQIKMDGEQAKNIYNTLTGDKVQQEGAAGHLYRKGKNITCSYTNVDMDDNKGKVISREDPRRYICVMRFDNNGLASGDVNF